MHKVLGTLCFILMMIHVSIASAAGDGPNMIAYVINMDESVDRLNYVMPRVNKLGFEVHRFRAFDGRKLTDAQAAELVDMPTYFRHFAHYPRKGTIGCSMSHINLWKQFVESNYDYALVFEDDVDFDAEKLKGIIDDLLQHTDKWDLVLFEMIHSGHPTKVQALSAGHEMVRYWTQVTHSGAYIINRKAATNLAAQALPITMPIDHYFTRWWLYDIKFRGVEPRVVHQRFGDSIIEASDSSVGAVNPEPNEQGTLSSAAPVVEEKPTGYIWARITKIWFQGLSDLKRIFFNIFWD